MRSSFWYISLLKCTGTDCYSNEKTNFRETFSIFHESFVKFYLKIGNKILIFENKNSKCGNLRQKKIKCARTSETKLVFYFSLVQ